MCSVPSDNVPGVGQCGLPGQDRGGELFWSPQGGTLEDEQDRSADELRAQLQLGPDRRFDLGLTLIRSLVPRGPELQALQLGAGSVSRYKNATLRDLNGPGESLHL